MFWSRTEGPAKSTQKSRGVFRSQEEVACEAEVEGGEANSEGLEANIEGKAGLKGSEAHTEERSWSEA